MKNLKLRVIFFFLLQILFINWGTFIFQKEANPFAVLISTYLFAWYSLKVFSLAETPSGFTPKPIYTPWLHGFVGMFGVFTAYEELRKIWLKFPNPEKMSDVLPQLKGQCALYFSGQFPYQVIPQPGHNPFPVYMPLHWAPIQIATILGIDARWSAIILYVVAVGVAGFWLSKTHAWAPLKVTLPAMLLFALPIWAFVCWGDLDIAVSLEGVVAAWYIILAAGLASKNHPLIIVGLIGALLSRYSMLFWTLPFAVLLWLHTPKKYSYWTWGIVAAAIISIFIVPFWMKDPTIVSKILDYYYTCSDNSWLRPDEYSFKEGLSLNIHLRHWLPGTPEQNQDYRNYPQVLVQLIIGALGVYYYQKKWRHSVDVFSYSMILLSIMTLSLYSFSPMLFRYYLLMPEAVSAVICWKVIASGSRATD